MGDNCRTCAMNVRGPANIVAYCTEAAVGPLFKYAPHTFIRGYWIVLPHMHEDCPFHVTGTIDTIETGPPPLKGGDHDGLA